MNDSEVPLWLEMLPLAVLGMLNFLGAAYETAILSASRSRISRAVESGGIKASSFLTQAASGNPSVFMRTDLLYVFTTALFMAYGLWSLVRGVVETGRSQFWLEAVLYLAVLFLIRMAANPVGDYFSERLVIAFAGPMSILTAPFLPLAWLAVGAEKVICRALGLEEEDEEDEREAEVIDAVSDGQLDGVVEDGQKEMIEGIFEFKDSDVADIIVPRTEMTTVDAESDLDGAVALAMEKGYSRLPAYRGNRDNIVGVFFVRDALQFWDKPPEERPPLESLLRPPLFVPETKLIPELLAEMRQGESHLAVVLDEYGGTAGLVTMEDVLEEIVGDIQDEFDSRAPGNEGKVRKNEDGTVIADGHAHVGEINKILADDIIPEDDDYETVAGFVLDNLGHIPKNGESFDFDGKISVRVLLADERRVRRVRISLKEESD